MSRPQSYDCPDFVSSYIKLLSAITDAPEEFQEAAALFLISTAAGRRWIFRSIPEAPFFSSESKSSGRILNLWFVLIGKSRITRKTSGVMNHVLEVCERVVGRARVCRRTTYHVDSCWRFSNFRWSLLGD